MDQLCIVTTGGTIDKIYFDDKSDYQIGEPQIGGILRELGVAFRFTVIPIIRKDSLHITDADRELALIEVALSLVVFAGATIPGFRARFSRK